MAFSYAENLLCALKELGLTTSEAVAYLTLLSIGQNPVSVIAKKAKFNRSACYSILERLVEKSLIKETIKNNIHYFQAVEPKIIIKHLIHKHNQIKTQIKDLSQLVITIEKGHPHMHTADKDGLLN